MDWRIYISLLLLIAAIVFGVLLATSDDESAPNVEEETSNRAERDQVVRPLNDDATGRRESPTVRATADPLPSSATSDGVSQPTTDSVRRTDPDSQSANSPTDPRTGRESNDSPAIPAEAGDMGAEEDMRPWNDPVNQRVLGDKRWMAPVSDEERDAIDETFRKAREARYDPKLSRVDTLASKDAAEAIIDDCYDELAARAPSMRGRLIVRWTSGADERGGWIRDPEIIINYKLEDPEFERCVLQRLDNAVFPAAAAEPRVIEHPFFYDGAF